MVLELKYIEFKEFKFRLELDLKLCDEKIEVEEWMKNGL